MFYVKPANSTNIYRNTPTMSFGGINSFQSYDQDLGLGHNGAKISLNYFDGTPEPSLLNSLANNDLKLIFKSLLKRDETTKEKALNDLTKLLCDTSPFDDIFLICWSQIYAKLLISESKVIRYQSHHITIQLIKLLNKKISKFLKDLIPFVLLGVCDTDMYVSKACTVELNECFQNDSKKVKSLWIVFHEQILKLAQSLIVVESDQTLADERYISKDELQFKYNRLLTGCINLMNNSLKLNEDMKQQKSIYKSILTEESLWKSLNLKSSSDIKVYESLILLIQLLFNNGYLQSHKEILKMAVRRIFKAITQVNAKNSMKFAAVTARTISILTVLTDYKNGKIWSYDKSSTEKLFNYLSAASNSFLPGDFSFMLGLVRKTVELENFDIDSQWIPLWENSLKKLNEKSFLGRYGAQLIEEFWSTYHDVISLSAGPNKGISINSNLQSTLRNGNLLSEYKRLKSILAEVADPNTLQKSIQSYLELDSSLRSKEPCHYFDNVCVLLLCTPDNRGPLLSLVEWIQATITSHPEMLNENKDILKLISYMIKSNMSFLSDGIFGIVYEVPVILDDSNYEILSDIIALFSNSKFIETNEDSLTVFEDFFTSAYTIGIDPKRITKTLISLNTSLFEKLKHSNSSANIKGFITEYIDSYNFQDNGELLKSQLLSDDNIIELYEKAVAQNNFESFCKNFPNLTHKIRETLLIKSDFLTRMMGSSAKDIMDNIYKVVVKSLDNPDIVTKLASALIENAQSLKFNSDEYQLCLKRATELIRMNDIVSEIFLPTDINMCLNNVVHSVNYRTSLISNFDLGTYLVPISEDNINLKEINSFLKFSLFMDSLLVQLPEYLQEAHITFLTIASELAGDYNCISESPIVSFYDLQNTLFKLNKNERNFIQLIEQVSNTESSYPDILSMRPNMEDSNVTALYKARIFQRVLTNEADAVSKSTLIQTVPLIEKYISTTIRSKNVEDIRFLLSYALLSVINRLASDNSLGKLRTMLASECIGVKESELVSKTFKIMILLNAIIEPVGVKETDVETFIPIAAQRLNMVLQSIGKWIDSDIVYDEEFSVVRIVLLRLFSSLLKYPEVRVMGETIFELSQRLLLDSFSMCELEDTKYILVLRQSCVKLFGELEAYDCFLTDYKRDLIESVSQLCLTEFHGEENNQISSMFYKKLNGTVSMCIASMSDSIFDDLFQKFISRESNFNITQTRVILNQLEKLVYSNQQESVIEFELSQQKLNGKPENTDESNEEEDNDKYKLPSSLISYLTEMIPQDYLEHEDPYTFIKYLWVWRLTLCYFKDVSYKMRQIYMDQLKEANLIDEAYTFIAEQIDLEDFKFWENLGPEVIDHYDIAENNFSPYSDDILNESKKLLGNLLYQLFNNVGSLTSLWYLNIKDRSLLLKIDKFVSKFISPILIKHELDDVLSKTDRLVSEDNDLSIKINNVTNEVKASYLIDEQKLEISFKLPTNYPLSNVQVIGVSRVGISEQKWKQWIMSTQHVITGMNGSVLDSLELFTRNVRLQFSGFEECAICYSILHAVDRKLPTKTCPTCNNKFHGACLYKWFRSSGNNTCPLCRSEIAFRK